MDRWPIINSSRWYPSEQNPTVQTALFSPQKPDLDGSPKNQTQIWLIFVRIRAPHPAPSVRGHGIKQHPTVNSSKATCPSRLHQRSAGHQASMASTDPIDRPMPDLNQP
ncbi:hypothetical protein ACLOJK_006928 [Asimina triloba]